MLHALGEVAGDRARDQVVHLSGAGEVLKDTPKRALRDALRKADLEGDLLERLVQDARRPELAVDRGEEEIALLLLRRGELRLHVPAEDAHDLLRQRDDVAALLLRGVHDLLADRVRAADADAAVLPVDIRFRPAAASGRSDEGRSPVTSPS